VWKSGTIFRTGTDIFSPPFWTHIASYRNIPLTVKQRKANWNGYTLRSNSLIKHVIERKVEGTGRRRRRCKQTLKELNEKKGY